MPWADKEPGPDCACGDPTVVVLDPTGRATLWCLWHSKEAGATFDLPSDRPDHWPDLTTEQMTELVDRGREEYEESTR